MKAPKVKLPQKDGAKKAAQIFEQTKKKPPSDRLVKIISEISPDEPRLPENKDRAARDAEI